MANNTKRVHSSEALKKYERALDADNMQEVETLLIKHARAPRINTPEVDNPKGLYWCVCGATCMDKKNNQLHQRGCDSEYELPSVVPHLEMSIFKSHVESIQLIRRLTTGEQPTLSLSSTQWCMSLTEVVKFRDSRVAELFGYRWLVSFPYMLRRDKKLYAEHVYRVFGTLIANQEVGYPDLNRTLIRKYMPILLPDYNDTIVWGRLMPEINEQELGELFILRDGLDAYREELVRKYGVLWRVRGKKLVKPKHIEIIHSLVRFVLYTFLGSYRDEHLRWFGSLLGHKQYLAQQTKLLVENLMKNPFLYNDVHHMRMSLYRYVPVDAAKYSYIEAMKVKTMTSWCFCFTGQLNEDEKEQQVGLLDQGSELVF